MREVDQDLVDEAVTGVTPEAFTALKKAASAVSLETVSKQTGVPVETIQEAAKIFAEASRSVIVCGEGIVRQSSGYDNVLNLIDLAWVTGGLSSTKARISAT